jgi:tRNA-specific 2-thiouridylase
MFPLGEMSKPEVREVARSSSLAVAEKAESQEICFVPDGDYAGFIDRYLDAGGREQERPARGEIVDTRGQVVGQHEGVHRYTVGQRRGLGLSRPLPLYVVRVEAESDRVVVGQEEELLSSEFTAAGVNWVAFDTPASAVRADVRIRYRHQEAPASITPLGAGRVRIRFDEPQRAVTPGQATVFYRGEEVVGGGWIVKEK